MTRALRWLVASIGWLIGAVGYYMLWDYGWQLPVGLALVLVSERVDLKVWKR